MSCQTLRTLMLARQQGHIVELVGDGLIKGPQKKW